MYGKYTSPMDGMGAMPWIFGPSLQGTIGSHIPAFTGCLAAGTSTRLTSAVPKKAGRGYVMFVPWMVKKTVEDYNTTQVCGDYI